MDLGWCGKSREIILGNRKQRVHIGIWVIKQKVDENAIVYDTVTLDASLVKAPFHERVVEFVPWVFVKKGVESFLIIKMRVIAFIPGNLEFYLGSLSCDGEAMKVSRIETNWQQLFVVET